MKIPHVIHVAANGVTTAPDQEPQFQTRRLSFAERMVYTVPIIG